MLIYLHPLHQSIREMKGEAWTIKHRLCLVDDAVVRGREDDDVRGIVVHALGEGNDVVSLYHQGIMFITYLLACHLAAVIVEKFQGVANGSVELAYFL